MSQAANATRQRPFRPGIAVSSPRAIWWTVFVLSVAAHVGLAVWVRATPLGYLDMDLLAEQRQPVRVKRATADSIVTQTPALDGSAASPIMTPAEISQALLEDNTLTPPESTFEPDTNLRDVLEDSPIAASEDALNLPAFSLPDQLLDQLSATSIDELGFNQGDAASAGDGASTGSAQGVAPGGGSASARRLLATAGITTGTTPAPPVLEAPTIDTPKPVDTALLAPPTEAVAIDFTDLALGGTTELVIPEHLDNDFSYSVTSWKDPGGWLAGDVSNDPSYFRVDISALRSLRKLEAMNKDVIFLIDTSGSIPQMWVEKAVRGVQESLPALNPQDRFNIVLFSESPTALSKQGPLVATPENIAKARAFLKGADSEGWTDVNAALRGLLMRDVTGERAYDIILVSDGQPTRGVLDTRELINLITRDNDLVSSIYCVGIGRSQNRELLDFLAYRNKGFSVFADRSDDAPVVIRDLLSRLRYPLINDLRVNVVGIDTQETYPLDLPNIHQGEQFQIFGRFKQAKPFTMHVTGRSAGRPVDFTFTLDLRKAIQGDRAVAEGWAFWKLHHLYSEMIRRGEEPALLAQIRELRKKYKLKTLY